MLCEDCIKREGDTVLREDISDVGIDTLSTKEVLSITPLSSLFFIDWKYSRQSSPTEYGSCK